MKNNLVRGSTFVWQQILFYRRFHKNFIILGNILLGQSIYGGHLTDNLRYSNMYMYFNNVMFITLHNPIRRLYDATVYRRLTDVETTSCLYWDNTNQSIYSKEDLNYFNYKFFLSISNYCYQLSSHIHIIYEKILLK